ncbi:hypothetical protein KDK95_11630 [Actinospica sp. MGRD01-02]|uniref:WXG100 family type VII secretion target n=1 Tax=Actinospica acidithermotolerans TaxID=2828514 RepID=A0A941E8E0_9ACTN|nr:hypothetical protein [Actinospica acidithermotolerans]MBR7826956.1 hypothetical protein [Actinospica acidithermotolerans]
MPDIAIDYNQVQSVSGQLNTAVTSTIVPELNTLASAVNGLLQSSGGLYLQATSPTLEQAYTKFNTDLNNAVQGITSFAQQFTQIAGQLHQMDTQMASSIKSGS